MLLQTVPGLFLAYKNYDLLCTLKSEEKEWSGDKPIERHAMDREKLVMNNDFEQQIHTALENKEYYLTTERDKALMALREANEQLEYMHKRRREFVSIVSHEFRSTLTAIQGFSEMMCRKDLSIAEMKEFAVDIHQDAKHLSHMVNEMLNLERMEMGRIQLHYEWFDLNAIIMEVVNRIQARMERSNIHVKLANALPVLMVDIDKLTQVIENLLDNAIKYSPDDRDVYISSTVEGRTVHVCVRDNGIGIPADAINRIFERYERVETKISKSIPGNGLGLSLVRQIVQAHGGQVWVESVLAEGSLFHFTIPFVNNPININGLLS